MRLTTADLAQVWDIGEDNLQLEGLIGRHGCSRGEAAEVLEVENTASRSFWPSRCAMRPRCGSCCPNGRDAPLSAFCRTSAGRHAYIRTAGPLDSGRGSADDAPSLQPRSTGRAARPAARSGQRARTFRLPSAVHLLRWETSRRDQLHLPACRWEGLARRKRQACRKALGTLVDPNGGRARAGHYTLFMATSQRRALSHPQYRPRRHQGMLYSHSKDADLGPRAARELTTIIERRAKLSMIVSD